MITITFGELSERFRMSDEACDILELNPYCLKEGLADYDDEIQVTEKQATALGIGKYEFNSRNITLKGDN